MYSKVLRTNLLRNGRALMSRRNGHDVAHHREIPPEYRPGTMDDLPVPSGSWQEAYDKAQRKNNLQLGAGAVALGLTLSYYIFTDEINFVTTPPMKNEK